MATSRTWWARSPTAAAGCVPPISGCKQHAHDRGGGKNLLHKLNSALTFEKSSHGTSPGNIGVLQGGTYHDYAHHLGQTLSGHVGRVRADVPVAACRQSDPRAAGALARPRCQ